MSRYKLPDAFLSHHTAVLGKTGAGKTSTSKLLIEQAVDAGERVCILDTIKSDWWGLTSSADGKRAGLPFKILGGPHGHVPLPSSAGRAIGELVASAALPLSIIDMADFEPGGVQRFFVDFAPVLLRRMRGVLHLVIEEAHEIAPKERAGFGAENMAIHWAKKLATAGRSKGIRLLVATQRTQSLHNALLGSCESVIVHRLTTPADQKPVLDWLKANTNREVLREVEDSLSSLKTGSAWLCSGEAQIFEQRALPRFRTYDNNATPTSSSGEHHVKTAPVDLEALRELIGEAASEAEANDPKALKAQVADLKRQLASRANGAAPAAAELTIKQLLKRRDVQELVHERAEAAAAAGYRRAHEELGKQLQSQEHDALNALKAVESLARILTKLGKGAEAMRAVSKLAPKPHPERLETRGEQVARLHAGIDRHLAPIEQAPRYAPPPAEAGELAINAALHAILGALAWAEGIGKTSIDKTTLGFLAGVSPTSSGYQNNLGKLRSAGLIDYPQPGEAALTDEGRKRARPVMLSRRDMHESVLRKLDKAKASILQVALEHYPEAVPRGAVAERAGVSVTSSGFQNNCGRLRSLGLLTYPSKETLAATPLLFPEGLQ